MPRTTLPRNERGLRHPWWEGVVVHHKLDADIWDRLAPGVESLYERHAARIPRRPSPSEKRRLLGGCRAGVEDGYREWRDPGAADLDELLLEAADEYLRERANRAIFEVQVLPRLELKLRGLASRFYTTLSRDPAVGSYEDLLQECLLKAAHVYAKRGHDLGENPDGYLYRAAQNRLVDIWERMNSDLGGEDEEEPRVLVSVDASESAAAEPADDDDVIPEIVALAGEVREARKAIADALPELICACEMCISRRREEASTEAERAAADRRLNAMAALRLRSYEEVENQDVAAMLGVSAPTATRLYQLGCELIRNTVRKRLPSEWEIEGPELF